MTPPIDTANSVVERILGAYGVDFARIRAPQKGYRNQSFPVVLPSGELLNLILYKREPGILARIKAANNVSDYLADQGFPTRKTASSKIVRLRSGRGVKYGALYSYLDGHTIPWEAYTQDHIKLLGKTMSDMHLALQQFTNHALPEVADEYLAITARMRRYFSQAPVQRAMAQKLGLRVKIELFDVFGQLLTASKLLPGKQPLHMDFVRSNILFQDVPSDDMIKVSISGILDFEKTAYGHPVFDIARTLSFLLVDCKYKPADSVRKYFIVSGYDKRGRTAFPRKVAYALLEPLINLFLLHDFYKFLRHNPYESLPRNEHFIRTKNFLLEQSVVSSSTA